MCGYMFVGGRAVRTCRMFFFSSRRRHTRFTSDWSSDVCSSDLEETLLDEYNSNNYSGSLQQPLFRLDRWFQFRQGKALTQSATAEFAYQQQETMIRVATSYFDVLYAKDSLSAAKAEVEAIGRQRDQAKKRFDVGLADRKSTRLNSSHW